MQDPHSAPGNLCPLNLQGIIDYSLLQPIETAAAYRRSLELEFQDITGNFDLAHFRAIHRYLFQDIFPWAGELRVVNISKGNSLFGPAQHISSALTETFARLSSERFTGPVPTAFAARAAFYFGEINAIHPFREGNGRAQREFIRQLALHAGHPFYWAGFTQAEMTNASIVSHTNGDNSLLAAIIERALLPPGQISS